MDRNAALLDEQESLRREQDEARRKPADKDAAPHCGRTGGQGARAERPSEGRHRTTEPQPPSETGRGGKAPSASDPKA